MFSYNNLHDGGEEVGGVYAVLIIFSSIDYILLLVYLSATRAPQAAAAQT
jgi:hypothetical protein